MPNVEAFIGYGFVGGDPKLLVVAALGRGKYVLTSINSTLLLVQWVGVCIITALLCAVLADKKKQ
jgi:hypothetical protein